VRKKSGLSKDISSILEGMSEKHLRKKEENVSSLLKRTSSTNTKTTSIKTSVHTGYGKAKKAIGIDLGENSIKVAWFSRGSVLNTAMSELPPGISEDKRFKAIAGTIQKILKEHKIKVRKANCTISGSSVFLRQIKLPQMSEEELKKTIKLEMKRIFPIDVNDAVMDFVILRETAERGVNKKELLIAGMERKYFLRLLSCLRHSGIQPLKIDVVPFSLLNCLLETEYSDDTTALVDIGAKETNAVIVRGKSLLFARQVQIGGNNFTKALADNLSMSTEEAERLKKEKDLFSPESTEFPMIRPVLEHLQRELERSLNYFTTAGGGYVNKILISGGTGKLTGLDSFLGEKMEVPVKIIKQLDPQFITAAGAAFNGTNGINFLSPRIEAGKKLNFRIKGIFAASVLGLVFIYSALLGTGTYLKKQSQNKKTQLLNSRPLMQKAKRTNALTKLIDRQQFPYLKLLQQLRSLIPEDVWITELRLNEGDNLKIIGRALSNVGVTQFLRRLENSQLIEKAKLDSIRQRQTTKREIVVFEIDCLIVDVLRKDCNSEGSKKGANTSGYCNIYHSGNAF
jgi:type IV pilus assembly protein PilM